MEKFNNQRFSNSLAIIQAIEPEMTTLLAEMQTLLVDPNRRIKEDDVEQVIAELNERGEHRFAGWLDTVRLNSYDKLTLPKEIITYESDYRLMIELSMSDLFKKNKIKYPSNRTTINGQIELRAYFDVIPLTHLDRIKFMGNLCQQWGRHVTFRRQLGQWLKSEKKSITDRKITYVAHFLNSRILKTGIKNIVLEDKEHIYESLMLSEKKNTNLFESIRDSYEKNSSKPFEDKKLSTKKEAMNVQIPPALQDTLDLFLNNNPDLYQSKNEFIESAIKSLIRLNKRKIQQEKNDRFYRARISSKVNIQFGEEKQNNMVCHKKIC